MTTLFVLALLVLVFQRQLLDTRQRGARTRSTNVAPGSVSAEASPSTSGAGSWSPLPDAVLSGDHMRGRLVDPRGRPIEAAMVQVGQQVATTGTDGCFTLPWAGGRLVASHPGFWERELGRSSLVLLRELDGSSLLGLHEAEARLPVLLVPGARVAGTVRVGTSLAAGARVVISTGQRRWEVRTDASGAFRSPLLPVTDLSLLVLYPGAQPSLTVLPPSFDWSHRAEISLKEGVALKVLVENESGRPIGDAEVWLRTVPILDGAGPGSAVQWEFVGWTDDLGRLDTARATHRPARIQVRTPGYAVAIRPILLTESRVRLRPAPALTGSAVDAETGLPLELLSVRLEVYGEGGFVVSPDQGQQAHTLGGGRFIVGLPPFSGRYRLFLRGAGNRSGYSPEVEFDGSEPPTPLLVKLDRGSVITGRVRTEAGDVPELAVELLSAPEADADGRELHGVRVPPEYRVVRATTTDDEGRFAFGNQGPGLYRVHVRLEGRREYYSPIFCPPLDEELPILLGRGSRVSGYLASAEGVAEAGVPLVLTDGDVVTRVTSTDSSGRYEFDAVPEGEYRLGIGLSSREHSAAVELRELTIVEGTDLRFNLRRTPRVDLESTLPD